MTPSLRIRRGGGTGRRTGLKNPRGQPHEGSIPSLGIAFCTPRSPSAPATLLHIEEGIEGSADSSHRRCDLMGAASLPRQLFPPSASTRTWSKWITQAAGGLLRKVFALMR